MDAQVKKRWVEALRSGKYKQGKERLASRKPHGKTQYCCLGVLCDLEGVKRHADGYGDILFGDDRYNAESAYLPRSFAEKVGIAPDKMFELAKRNDGSDGYSPHTFEEIADYIEKEL